MFSLTFPLAILSAISGLGIQIVLGPLNTFMLGFSESVSGATGLVTAFFTAAAAVFIIHLSGHTPVNISFAIIIALGATIGALFTIQYSTIRIFLNFRRVALSITILISLMLIRTLFSRHIGGPISMGPDWLLAHPALNAVLIGLLVGSFSTLFQIPSGAILIPALYWLSPANESSVQIITTSLIVIIFAGLLPTLTRATLVNREYGKSMIIAGIIGGGIGGFILNMTSSSPAPLVISCILSMFLCAWQAYRIS